MTAPKLAVHADIIEDFLRHGGEGPSVLRVAMSKFFCYTTVFSAIELFAGAATEHERSLMEDAMSAMKILGLNAKSARRYGEWFRPSTHRRSLALLSAGLCLESRLPVLTAQPSLFRGVKGIRVIPAARMRSGAAAAEILQAARTF